jgi:hypothetical protein
VVAVVTCYDCCEHCERERGEFCKGGIFLHEAPCPEGCNDGEWGTQ